MVVRTRPRPRPSNASVDQLDHADEADVPEAIAASVVKMKLNSFCRDARLAARLRELVTFGNQLCAEAYAFANLHVIRIIEARRPLPKIDQDFYYRCLVCVSETDVRATTLSDDFQVSRAVYDALRPSDGSNPILVTRKLNSFLVDLSRVLATAGANHLWTNFEGRLKRYIRWRYPRLRKKAQSIVWAVCSGKSNSALAPDALLVVNELRALLPGVTSDKVIKAKPHLTLLLYHKILTDTIDAIEEAKGAKRSLLGARVFSLLPVKGGFTISHMPVSKYTLVTLLKGLGMEEIKGDGRNMDTRTLWANYFNLKRVETSQRRFAERILTDGYAVSVHMLGSTPSHVASSAPAAALDGALSERERLWRGWNARGGLSAEAVAGPSGFDDVGGVDPGFNVVATATFASGRRVAYSSARYYQEAGFNTSQKRTDAWNAQTLHVVEDVPSPKVCTVAACSAYVRWLLKELPVLLWHRATKGYRNMRFMRYVGKQRTVSRIVDALAPRSQRIVLGFGDWSIGNASPISRPRSGPVEEIKRELARRSNVMLMDIDEFRTSKLDSLTHKPLTNMVALTRKRQRDGSMSAPYRSRIHSVLHCKNSGMRSSSFGEARRYGATWNRDVNASINMLNRTLERLLGQPRHPDFARAPQKPKRTKGPEALNSVQASPGAELV
jgi:hypothetical protein